MFLFTCSPNLALSNQNAILSGNGWDAVEFIIALQVRDYFVDSTHLQTFHNLLEFAKQNNRRSRNQHQAFQYLCRAEVDESSIEQFLVEYLKQIAPRQFFLRTRCASASCLPWTAGASTPSLIHRPFADSKDAVEHLNQELGRFVALDGTPNGEEQVS